MRLTYGKSDQLVLRIYEEMSRFFLVFISNDFLIGKHKYGTNILLAVGGSLYYLAI